jgi:hypothetical protein
MMHGRLSRFLGASSRQPPPPAVHDLTPIEQWISEVAKRSMPAFALVPENNKEEVILGLANFLMWNLTTCREPITITPTELPIDLSGRR